MNSGLVARYHLEVISRDQIKNMWLYFYNTYILNIGKYEPWPENSIIKLNELENKYFEESLIPIFTKFIEGETEIMNLTWKDGTFLTVCKNDSSVPFTLGYGKCPIYKRDNDFDEIIVSIKN